MKNLLLTLGLVVGCSISSIASATIIGGAVTGGTSGGTFLNLGNSPVGLVVGNDTIQDPNLYGFNEDQNIVLSSDLAIDVGGVKIASGLEVASHYIYFDPKVVSTVNGWVDFDSEILGIITSTPKLAASDFLINNSVTYLNPSLRGLESNDSVWIDSSNNQRLGLSFYASSPGDYIRVLTATSPSANVPAPATLLLFIFGLVLLASKPQLLQKFIARKI